MQPSTIEMTPCNYLSNNPTHADGG